MNSQRVEQLRSSVPLEQLRTMKLDTLTLVDAYMYERGRCEVLNPQYKNQGLNTKINMNLKKIAILEDLIEERLFLAMKNGYPL